MLLPTCLVGSYPQPEWLIDQPKLSKQVPRLRMRDLWLVDEAHLEAAQDDATLLAIRDQERAGLDIITDGEMRRESYSNRFATALEGVDVDNPGTALDRSVGANFSAAFGRVTEQSSRAHRYCALTDPGSFSRIPSTSRIVSPSSRITTTRWTARLPHRSPTALTDRTISPIGERRRGPTGSIRGPRSCTRRLDDHV